MIRPHRLILAFPLFWAPAVSRKTRGTIRHDSLIDFIFLFPFLMVNKKDSVRFSMLLVTGGYPYPSARLPRVSRDSVMVLPIRCDTLNKL